MVNPSEKTPAVVVDYHEQPEEEEQDKTSWTAWIVLFCTALINAACAIMWMTPSSAPDTMSAWMQADLTQLNWLSNVCAISNTVFSIAAAWGYERFGTKTCLIVSGGLNLVGSWIRCIASAVSPEKRYALVMLGQTIAGIGGPFVYNIGPKLVAVWFAPQHRTFANMLASLSLGMIAAPLMMPVLADITDHVPRTLLITAIIATACAVPIVLTPSKPKHAPSKSAAADRTSIWAGTKALAKSPQFWSLAIMAATNAGMFYTLTIIIVEASTPYGYSAQQGGIGGTIAMVAGYIGGAMTGYWVGHTAQHLMLIKILTPMLCASYVFLIFEIVPNAFPVLLIACILIGFFSLALLPVQLEYGCEITYPIPESISSNIIWSLTTVGMLIFTVVIDAFRAGPDADLPNNMRNSIIVVAVIVCVGSLPCLWLRGELKRLNVDQSKSIDSSI